MKHEKFDCDNIKKYLCREAQISVFDTVTSTNDIARSAAIEGAPEGSLFVANSQSAGRGRVGKSFFSPCGTGLYMSIVLRPELSVSNALYITVAAAVATAQAIESVTGKSMSIKWVNDIFSDRLKVCGILAEASFARQAEKIENVVLGIGVNITAPKCGFGELEGIAGALFLQGEDMPNNIRERLATEIYNRFFTLYGMMDSDCVFNEYESRLFIVGKNITVVRGDMLRRARVLSLERDYSLKIEYENGETARLQSGEISIISD